MVNCLYFYAITAIYNTFKEKRETEKLSSANLNWFMNVLILVFLSDHSFPQVVLTIPLTWFKHFPGTDVKAIWLTNNNKWNPQISNECKVTQFLHFKGKSPFHQFPNKWEESTFDTDCSRSSAGSVSKEIPLLEHSLGKFHYYDIVLSRNCFL